MPKAGKGGEEVGVTANSTEFLLKVNENVLKLDRGAGCAILWIY